MRARRPRPDRRATSKRAGRLAWVPIWPQGAAQRFDGRLRLGVTPIVGWLSGDILQEFDEVAGAFRPGHLDDVPVLQRSPEDAWPRHQPGEFFDVWCPRLRDSVTSFPAAPDGACRPFGTSSLPVHELPRSGAASPRERPFLDRVAAAAP